MVKPHYRDRYQSAIEVVEDIYDLANPPRVQTASQSKSKHSGGNTAPQSKSKQAGGSTVISNATKQQAVTARQQSFVSDIAPDEPRPKRSFGFAIALSIMGAVAATLGISQLVDYLQSNPTIQPIAQTPPSSSPLPVESPVDSPSPLAVTPEASPSAIASATPEVSPQGQQETTFASPMSSLQGQSVVSITDTNCLTTNATPNYQSFQKPSQGTTKDLTIGQEVVTSVATLSSVLFRSVDGSDIAVLASTPAGVACQINSPDSSSQFGALTLVFGLSNTSLYVGQASKVRLTAFLDQKNIGSKEVIRGGKQVWNINVANIQNIALQAECIKGNTYPERGSGDQFELCPAIVFTQADLK